MPRQRNKTETKPYSPHFDANQRDIDKEYYASLTEYFEGSPLATLDKLRNFTKHVPIGEINKFLVKEKIFRKLLNVHGSIVECGVFQGGGVMTWAVLSAIYEPLNHNRHIFGFDTFSGFPSIHQTKDDASVASIGSLAADSYDDISRAEQLYNSFRPLGHIKKVHLVRGDVSETFPQFIDRNPHIVVSLLYLDFDLFEPTKLAIEYFFKRMPKGGIIAFDEMNVKPWPGETLAVLETVGIENLRLRRFPHYPNISYAVK